MRVECRPISNYPVSQTLNRRRAPFHRKADVVGSSWKQSKRILLSDALGLLEREAQHIGCRHLVIEADYREGQIRNDGWPRADAKPSSPRVVTRRGEQYSGWKALPSQATTTLTTESAAAVLVALAEPQLDSLEARRRINGVLTRAAIGRELYLAGVKRHHPDAGGDAEKFKALGQAWQVLKEAGVVTE